MAKMRNSLATIVFVVLAFSTSSAQSRITRECVDFSHSYCNRFNYSTAIFPNPRGHETPEEAASEFSDFYGLLNNNACHPKLGTLLCFIYFPLCNKANYNSEDPLVDGFFPCQELCEEVHASVCNDIILRNVGSWAPHLRCNFTDEDSGKKYYQNAISLPNPPNCVNGIAPRFVPAVNECARGTHTCNVNAYCINTPESYDCVCREGFAGDGRTCEDVNECSTSQHNCHQNAHCTNTIGSYNCTCNTGYTGDGKQCSKVCTVGNCGTCKFRANTNSKTFKNNCFCYAARVHVTSYRVENCNHVYSVTVKEQFNLRTPYNSSYFTTAPALARDEEITVVISPSHCDKCPELSLDQEYIIGGDYIRNDGNVEWHLVGSSNKALAGIWKSKYNSRMAKWIEDGNNSSDRLQCQQCE